MVFHPRFSKIVWGRIPGATIKCCTFSMDNSKLHCLGLESQIPYDSSQELVYPKKQNPSSIPFTWKCHFFYINFCNKKQHHMFHPPFFQCPRVSFCFFQRVEEVRSEVRAKLLDLLDEVPSCWTSLKLTASLHLKIGPPWKFGDEPNLETYHFLGANC